MVNICLPRKVILLCLLILLPWSILADCTCSISCEEPEDKSHNTKGALKYKLGAIASIFVASLIGVCLPIFGRRIPTLSPETNLFFIIKAFAAGVILATGFIHVLPDAVKDLTSPCLSENPWRKFPFAGFVAMMAAIFTLVVDVSATSHYKKAVERSDNDQDVNDDEENENNGIHIHASHGHAHGDVLTDGNPLSTQLRYRVISQVIF